VIQPESRLLGPGMKRAAEGGRAVEHFALLELRFPNTNLAQLGGRVIRMLRAPSKDSGVKRREVMGENARVETGRASLIVREMLYLRWRFAVDVAAMAAFCDKVDEPDPRHWRKTVVAASFPT
jgi:hypothetical protein